MNRIYLDYNATTPLAPEVAHAMQPFLASEFGNASSTHWAGQRMRTAIERARQQVAALLHCASDEVVFTSGGTEANNAALVGVFFAKRNSQTLQIVISNIEHPSITKTCDFLERLGASIARVPVDRTGLVDPDDVRRAITSDTILVSIMHANNEVGTIQPIREISAITSERNVLLHSDAAQTGGKIPVDVASLGVDLLTLAGHKMYAPQGVGALFIRQGTQLEPFLHGAGHENGRRAGTENVASIVGLGTACEISKPWIQSAELRDLTEYFWSQLHERFQDRVVLNGHAVNRLPNTLNVSFLGQHSHEIFSRLPELAASTGSACHAGSTQVSAVLSAMGVSNSAGAGAIRFSLGRSTVRAEIDRVVELLAVRIAS